VADDYSPVRVGRHVTLRPLRPGDYDTLHEIALFSDSGSRWRLHGAAPPVDQFVKLLFEGAPATFAIEANEDRRVVGMVQLWNYSSLNRNGHITAFVRPELRGRGWPLEGIFLFIEHVFPVFNLRKLYFESLDTEVVQYGSLVGPFLRREALYREHQWSFGRLADVHVLALYEEDLPRLLGMAFPDRRALAVAEVAPV